MPTEGLRRVRSRMVHRMLQSRMLEKYRLLEADYVLSGAVTVLDEGFLLNAHLLEVETARVALSASARGEGDDPVRVVRKVAEELAEGLDFHLPELRPEDIDRHPEANLHFMRGLGYYHAHMRNHAVAQFMKALSREPGFARARYWLATCYVDLAEYRHAEIELERFLEDYPEHPLADRVKAQLQTCREHLNRHAEDSTDR